MTSSKSHHIHDALPHQKGPTKFGILLYPGFEVLDVFGPLEALNVISRTEFNNLKTESEQNGGPALNCIEGVELHVISSEKDLCPLTAVAPHPPPKENHQKSEAEDEQKVADSAPEPAPAPRQIGAAKYPAFVPTCTISTVPSDLEVLIIPGGLGSSSVSEEVISWLRSITPNLRYLFTICTGSLIAARAGVLDGLRATTNKQAWSVFSPEGLQERPFLKNTYWVADARWVVSSPKIWTTSGVSAGTDGFVAWMKEVYGRDYGEKVCLWMEYRAETEAVPVRFDAGLSDVKPASWGGGKGWAYSA